MSRWNGVFILRAALVIGALLTLASAGSAQDVLWTRTFGGSWQDGAFDITETADGGLVVTGFNSSQNPSHYQDLCLFKTDAAGNMVWNQTYRGTLNSWGSEVLELPDGGFLVAGVYEVNPQTHDSYVVRTDPGGNMIWQRWYDAGIGDDDRAHAICLTDDGGFLIAGQAWQVEPPFGSYNVYVVKCDAAGNRQWSQFYKWASEGADVALSTGQAPDGGFFIAGFTQSDVWDAYVVRTDPLGNLIWQKTYGGGWGDEAYGMHLTPDGGFVLTGAFISNATTDADVGLVKVDAGGNVEWERVYGGNDADWGQQVCQTLDGGYLVAGFTGSFGMGVWDGYVLRMSPSGDLLWTTTLGGESDDRAFAIEPTNDGGAVAAGWSWSFGAGLGDAYLVKLEDGATVDVAHDGSSSDLPGGRETLRVSPNPFSGSTRLVLTLPPAGRAELMICDAAGRIVRTFGIAESGKSGRSITWDGRDDGDRTVPPGIYFGTVLVGGRTVSQKMIRLPSSDR